MVIHGISIPSGAIKSNQHSNQLDRGKRISIPSGAIKSNLPYLRTLKNFISIPSGAIKRAPLAPLQLGMYSISIPSGAIKSGYRIAFDFQNVLFQFLLVRLRDSIS